MEGTADFMILMKFQAHLLVQISTLLPPRGSKASLPLLLLLGFVGFVRHLVTRQIDTRQDTYPVPGPPDAIHPVVGLPDISRSMDGFLSPSPGLLGGCQSHRTGLATAASFRAPPPWGRSPSQWSLCWPISSTPPTKSPVHIERSLCQLGFPPPPPQTFSYPAPLISREAPSACSFSSSSISHLHLHPLSNIISSLLVSLR